MSILMRGLHGEPVRILQQKLGVDADGVFGIATETALKEYQAANDLVVDGLAGPDTFSQMELWELVLLTIGSHGDAVTRLQSGLGGIDVDGKYGHGTAAAVKKFQEENGLEADGVAGPSTLAVVPGFEISAEQIAAATITDDTLVVESTAVDAAKAEPPPPEEHQSLIAKVEDKVAAVGTSIWNTVKSIF